MHKNKFSPITFSIFAGLFLVALVLPVGIADADTKSASDNDDKSQAARKYSKRGADTCLKCHDEDSEFPVFPIFKTKHAERADPRTPFAKLQCETCHGAIGKHGKKRLRKGEERQPMITFGSKSREAREQQNHICLQCHERYSRIGWTGSVHDNEELVCADCHRVHVARDKVLIRAKQPQVCYDCHPRQRAQSYQPSIHPIRYGKIACSDCHQAHDSQAVALLDKPTLNQTCYTCHPETRGPFLWEHAPVAENCALCHLPHGSIHPALLIKRPPLLCQQCHSQAGHPSLAYTGAGLPSGSPSGFLLAKSCLNCHSQVHGSNHPSGVKLMR